MAKKQSAAAAAADTDDTMSEVEYLRSLGVPAEDLDDEGDLPENLLNPDYVSSGDAPEVYDADAETGDDDDTGEDETGDDDTGEEEGDDAGDDEGEGEGDDAGDDEEEGDDAGEGEGETDTDTDTDTGDKGKAEKEPFIPKSRFDEVNIRRKEAERRLQEMQQQQTQQQTQQQDEEPFDFDAKEKEFFAAVQDGEEDRALAIRREIREAEQRHYERQAQQVTQQATVQTQAKLEFDAAYNEAVSTYPELDVTNEEQGNPDLVQEANELINGFVQQGYSQANALRRAVNYVAKLHDLTPAEQRQANSESKSTEPASDTKKGKSETEKKPTREDRKKKENMRKKQPPKTGTSRSEETDLPSEQEIASMTEEEWDALPDATRNRLLGIR